MIGWVANRPLDRVSRLSNDNLNKKCFRDYFIGRSGIKVFLIMIRTIFTRTEIKE